MPRIYPSKILRSSQGELGVETESFPCKRRESVWEMSHTSRPHDGILVRCVGHDQQTRAACLSVRLSVCRAQLSPEPGLARADSWGSCPPDACWTEDSRSVSSLSRSPKVTVKQSSSGMGREGFGVMADPISAQRSPRCWVRCSKVGTSGCTQHCSGAWWGLAHLCAWSP